MQSIDEIVTDEMVEAAAEAISRSFQDRISELSGEQFADTGVAYPAMEVFRRYSRAAIKAALSAIDLDKVRRETNEDKARLDFLDACNRRLNEHYGTTYRWELILNHNVNRLMLGRPSGEMQVDLNDSAANGLQSCRDVIDKVRAAVSRGKD